MSLLFRNPEFRHVSIKLLLIQIVSALAIFAFTGYELANFNKAVVNQNTALAGKVLLKHPELAAELADLIVREASVEDIGMGRNVLEQYGYDEGMRIYSHPVLGELYGSMEAKAVILVLLSFIPIFLIVKREYDRVYSKVRNISAAAEKVIDGDFGIVLPDNDEGDFCVLGRYFNQMAARLKMSLDSLKNDKDFLKNIISDISHQLKTPLSSLIMFNELMLGDDNMAENTKTEFLLKSKSQLERMEWLIISLLKMARLEAGAISFKHIRIRLPVPVENAVAALSIKDKQRNLRIRFAGNPDEAWFTGDEEWMTEALINILKNCIEHTGEGGEIEIQLNETPLFSRIVISDNGEGIDKKDIPHVFERFYRGSNSVKAESVGIGLALSRLIIEGQGGDISVKSEKGRGTEFTITFLKGTV